MVVRLQRRRRGLGERADRRDRRLQLVRDVRDEVAANAIEPVRLGEVGQQQHGRAVGERDGARPRRLGARDPERDVLGDGLPGAVRAVDDLLEVGLVEPVRHLEDAVLEEHARGRVRVLDLAVGQDDEHGVGRVRERGLAPAALSGRGLADARARRLCSDATTAASSAAGRLRASSGGDGLGELLERPDVAAQDEDDEAERCGSCEHGGGDRRRRGDANVASTIAT